MPEMTLEGGVRIRTYTPPRLRSADRRPADLERYGFPARPDDPHHLARYRQVFGQLKQKFHYVQPTFRVNTDRHHGPRARGTEEATETSTNWSGGVVYAPAGASFRWVEGDWVVPNVDAPTQSQWYYTSSWIGIDGDGSRDVCQAGVECDVYQSGSSITRQIYPWWEWYPNFEVQITNLAVSAGDMITMLICTSGANATTASVALSRQLYRERVEVKTRHASRRCDGILPLRGSFGSEDSQCGSGDEVALKVEGVMNRAVHA